MSARAARRLVLGDRPEMRRAGAVVDREIATVPAWRRFSFPSPPSLNNAYQNVPGRGRVPTKRLDDWKREADWNIRADFDGRRIEGDFVAILSFERSRRDDFADLDNRVKFALDALVNAGVVVDDSFNLGHAACWLPASSENRRPRAFVSISKATAFVARFLPLGAGRGGWFIDQAGDHDLTGEHDHGDLDR